jgi:hypothetical protein
MENLNELQTVSETVKIGIIEKIGETNELTPEQQYFANLSGTGAIFDPNGFGKAKTTERKSIIQNFICSKCEKNQLQPLDKETQQKAELMKTFKLSDIEGINYIKFNPLMLWHINYLQAGGTIGFDNINPSDYDNNVLDGLLNELTRVQDFLMFIFEMNGNFELNADEILKHCQYIRHAKESLNFLRA